VKQVISEEPIEGLVEMDRETHEIRLSVTQLEFLRNLSPHDKSVDSALNYAEEKSPEKLVIRLSRDIAEKLRSQLTEKLAEVGFEKDYSPNFTGRMLEDLIDTLFIP
jgi:hypothetical protein